VLQPPWSQAAPGDFAGEVTLADPTDKFTGRPDEELPLSPPAATWPDRLPPMTWARSTALDADHEPRVITSNINSITHSVK
jgi:hypothetical protein